MLVNRIILSVLCAGALVVGEVRASQSAEESQATQQPSLKRAVYSIEDLLPRIGIPDPKSGQGPVEELIRRIIQTIQPESWADMGGTATIQSYPVGQALVVNQTQVNHDKIVDFLVALRRSQEVEVVVETRILSMSPATAKTFTLIAGYSAENGGGSIALDGVAFLNERQVKGWMDMLQGDRELNVLKMPKATVDSGQQFELNVGDEVIIPTLASDARGARGVDGQETVFVGNRGKFLPVVSADRHFVRLNIDWTSAAMVWKRDLHGDIVKLTLNKQVVLPSGGTVVCSLGTCNSEVQESCGPSVLSKIPYLSRLFTNVGYGSEERHYFLMVTTRVVSTCDGECACPRIPR
jgi:general secretion pathway protein D